MANTELTLTASVSLDDESKQLLREIRDRLPKPTADPAEDIFGNLVNLAAAKRQALRAVIDALDGWIEGAHSNHEASGHRGEIRGEECWRTFTPGDIRNMINDACREVGVKEFPYPRVPKEDTV